MPKPQTQSGTRHPANILKVKLYRFAVHLVGLYFWRKKLPSNLKIVTRSISGKDEPINIRIYTPDTDGPFPIILFFHGGGFVIGDLDSHDPICRDLCVKSNHIVIAVDYRLAPEHPFPAAVQDCLDALGWTVENSENINGMKNRIVTAGDSAGGNLATVVALQARTLFPGLLKGQILLYPTTHHYSYGTQSYQEKGKGYGLSSAMMVWFWDLYYQNSKALAPGQVEHELATPLAVDDLSELPPALIIIAENDPLRDEAVAYAERLTRISHK